ncbi:MAG: cupin domain-containing protein [Candidatus Berkelbacteria bacterium]
MDKFIYQKPIEPSFPRGTFDGYNFAIENNILEIDLIDSKTGHGGKGASNKITHIYYILEGNGEFEIDGKIYPVSSGELVEIPPKHIFDYNGKMKMLLIMEPPYSSEHASESPQKS